MRSWTALVLIALACFSSPGTAADLAGTWTGTWTKEGSALPVVVTFQSTARGLSGSFDSDALQVAGIPFQDVRYAPPKIHFVLVGDRSTTTFDGNLSADAAEGTFTEGTTTGSFRLTRTRAVLPALRLRSVEYRDDGVKIAGTLFLPADHGRYPAILLLHGSGPEGRWANRYLAERFARAGFVALITDKRGVGQSTGDWHDAGFTELAADAVSGMRFLKTQPEVDPQKIGIYGHSQGGTLAPMIAAHAGFVIASAAAGVDPADAEEFSVGNAIGISALPVGEQAEAQAFVHAIVDVGYRGRPRSELDRFAARDKGRAWYFDPPPASDYYWVFSRRIASFNPAAYWSRVTAPVLLVYGEKDERVPPKRSSTAIIAALRAGGNKDVTLKMYPGADHTFSLPTSGAWPKHVPGYADTLIAWAQHHGRSDGARPSGR